MLCVEHVASEREVQRPPGRRARLRSREAAGLELRDRRRGKRRGGWGKG